MTNIPQNHYIHPQISDELSIEHLTNSLFEINKELLLTNKKLKESETLRKQTISNLSHDLRSPLSSIIGHVEFLLISDINDKETFTESLNLIKSKLFIVSTMLNDMLYLSILDSEDEINKVDATNYKITKLFPFLKTYYESQKKDVRYNKRTLNLILPEEFNCDVNIYPNRIIRVLDNLYNNALKFTSEKGTITLSVSSNNHQAQIAVIDDGIGISNEYQKKIFERSYVISDARTPTSNNSCGLGLSIALSIIRQHGGDLYCTSEPKHGSTFTFTLPAIITNS